MSDVLEDLQAVLVEVSGERLTPVMASKVIAAMKARGWKIVLRPVTPERKPRWGWFRPGKSDWGAE